MTSFHVVTVVRVSRMWAKQPNFWIRKNVRARDVIDRKMMIMSWMKRIRAPLLAVFTLVTPPSFTFAQDAVPPRDANIWKWRAHEPVPSFVHRDEYVDGIAPSAAQQQKANDEVESLYRLLMGEGEAGNAPSR